MNRTALALLGVVCLCAAQARADTNIVFNTLPIGTRVDSQYHRQGIDFFARRPGVFANSHCDLPRVRAINGERGLDLAACSFEFFTSGTFIQFAVPHRHVVLYIGSYDPVGTLVSVDNIGYSATNPPGYVWGVSGPARGGLVQRFEFDVPDRLAPLSFIEITTTAPNAPIWLQGISFDDGVTIAPDFLLTTVETTFRQNDPMRIDITRVGGSTGPITLRAEGVPAGLIATFNPATVTTQDRSLLTLHSASGLPACTYNPADPDGLPNTIRVIAEPASSATAPGPRELSRTLANLVARVRRITPLEGNTPRRLLPGTEVTLDGNNFCPSATVRFGAGNTYSDTPGRVSADGHTLRVNVPRLALSGPVTVINGGTGSAFVAGSFTVHSFRNTGQFQFVNPNYLPLTDHRTFEELYGRENTNTTVGVDICFLLGLGSCPLSASVTDMPRADVTAYEAVLSIIITASGGGLCFGMDLGAQRFVREHENAFYRTLSGPLPRTPYEAETGIYPRNILWHLSQFSGDFLGYYDSRVASQGPLAADAWDGQHFLEQLRAAFNAGDFPLVTMRFGSAGHVVTAIDLEKSNFSGGYALLNVSDPNLPFLPGEATNPGTHQDRERRATIRINTDGSWSFVGAFTSAPWSGDRNRMVVVPYAVVPMQPHLPDIPTLLGAGLTLAFNSTATTEQIEDEEGRTLLLPDGSDNLDPATMLRDAAPFPPLAGFGGGPIPYLLPAGQTLVYSVRGNGGAPYAQTIIGPGMVATVKNVPNEKGVVDRIELNGQSAVVGFTSGGPAKPFQLEMTAIVGDRGTRTVRVFLDSSGKGDRVFFDAERESFTIDHHGAATTARLEMAAGDPLGAASSLSTKTFQLDAETKAVLRPDSWSDLSRGAKLEATNASGTQLTRFEGQVSPAQGTFNVRSVHVSHGLGHKHATTVTAKYDIKSVPKGSSAAMTFAILDRDGKNLIAHGTAPLDPRDLRDGAHEASWKFQLPSGAWQAVAVLQVVTPTDAGPTTAMDHQRQAFTQR